MSIDTNNEKCNNPYATEQAATTHRQDQSGTWLPAGGYPLSRRFRFEMWCRIQRTPLNWLGNLMARWDERGLRG